VSGPSGIVLPWNPDAWFATSVENEPLQINLSAAVPVVVCLTYFEYLSD